jgi:hypothetical protein
VIGEVIVLAWSVGRCDAKRSDPYDDGSAGAWQGLFGPVFVSSDEGDHVAASITERQNEPQHMRRLLAYSHLYRLARRWHAIRMAGTLGLAGISPIVVVLWPDGADLLAAIAAGWLVIGRTCFTWLEDKSIDRAARCQESFDVHLFGLPWNHAVAGKEPSPDDISACALKMKDDRRYRNWYTVDVQGLPEAAAVVLCQRQSAVWARRDHVAYAAFLTVAAAAWFAVGIVFALARDMTLADYLVMLFLPSAPVYLDAFELARSHYGHATARTQLEQDLDDLWRRYTSHVHAPTSEDCRTVQDAAFVLRRDGPRVPNWFYRIRRNEMTKATTEGARTLRDPNA